jgi:hypothetical protein
MIKKIDINLDENFSEKHPGTSFLTTKGMKKFGKSLK